MNDKIRRNVKYDPVISLGHLVAILPVLLLLISLAVGLKLEIRGVDANSKIRDLELQINQRETVTLLKEMKHDVRVLEGSK